MRRVTAAWVGVLVGSLLAVSGSPARAQGYGGYGAPSGGYSAPAPQPKKKWRQYYTPWKYQGEKQRYVCYYYFKPSPGAASYKKHTVVHYPQPERNQYLYYYNPEEGKYWGRCVSQHHPQYKPDIMVWNFSHDAPPGKNWGELTAGNPHIPGSEDRVAMKKAADPPPPPFAE